MQIFTAALLAPVTACMALFFTPRNKISTTDIQQLKFNTAVSCMPDRQNIIQWLAEAEDIPLMPGSGKYTWKINTTSDSAQLYFNQGINMYYGFHIIEAMASFKKAAKFDADNAMICWAQALTLGPNINDVGYAASPEALETTAKAVEWSNKLSEPEKGLINAMTMRYSADSTKTREELNQAYVDAMKKLHETFPRHLDIAVLYADAMMLQHPWDLWEPDGKPKPWEPLIQQTLEKALKDNAKHPGANHYYIHVMEASPTPSKALASADILETITPGLAHLVHMPSHIYLRTGALNKGVEKNKIAVQRFKEYATIFSPSAGNAFIYYWHNLHMIVNSAMLAGNYEDAINAANELRNALDTGSLNTPAPIGSYLFYMYMAPLMVDIQFENWSKILEEQKPDSRYIYGNILYHFGQGMALASTKKIADAQQQVTAMKELMKDTTLHLSMPPFSPVIEGANVALELLNGTIQVNTNNATQAVEHFKLAAEREWHMTYNEPRDWMLNPYQYLGFAYIKAKNYKKAAEAFKKDLSRNAKNSWSQKGLDVAYKQAR